MDIAKLFNNGHSQAVRLPDEYRFEGTEVYIKKLGDMVVLIPRDSVWRVFESGIEGFSLDCLADRTQPLPQERNL